MVFHQVLGVLACFVVVILILGFAIQFWRERGSTSEKVNLGCILLKKQYFPTEFQMVLLYLTWTPRTLRRWRRIWLKMWTGQKLLLSSWTSANRPQGRNSAEIWKSLDNLLCFHFRFKGTFATLNKTDQVMSSPTWSRFNLFLVCLKVFMTTKCWKKSKTF